jgi:class 3 adenylate cyclase
MKKNHKKDKQKNEAILQNKAIPLEVGRVKIGTSLYRKVGDGSEILYVPVALTNIASTSAAMATWDLSAPALASGTFSRQIALQKELNQLAEKAATLAAELTSEKKRTVEQDKELDDLRQKLEKRERLNHFIGKVSSDGFEMIYDSQETLEKFNNSPQEMTVVSLDLRRSTALMLNAKSEEAFALFMNALCRKISEIFVRNYGIIDKFTGDGMIAYFPTFYSGQDAIIHAAKAALECHNAFEAFYQDSKATFHTVLKSPGIGVGIDSGQVFISSDANEITIVGRPVVYACRIASANHSETFLNQSARDHIESLKLESVSFEGAILEIKNEGEIEVYRILGDLSLVIPKKPSWKK